jgi:hypothetical protein
MSTRTLAHAVAIGAMVLTASLAAAQPRGGRGMGMPHYDKSTEVTVKGTVEAVLTSQQGTQGMRGMGMGTHLTFRTESGDIDVHVGPSWWLTEQKLEFAKGDQLQIVGSSITFNGGKALIAREITKGDRKITLRDANGFPVWSGRGRRTQS